jgi:hypothetical protein
MPVSQAQLDVWKARAKLDRKLAKMTFAQKRKYLAGAAERLKAKTGIDLNLPVLTLERDTMGAKGKVR